MRCAARSRRNLAAVAVIVACASVFAPAQDLASGVASAAWDKWAAAMQNILERKPDAAETALGELLEMGVSPLRLAMFADRSVRRGQLGGGVLLLEQDYKNGKLGENGGKIAERLEIGREQLHEADDGWYFASIGRFDVSNANFRALLASDPDPAALLEFAEMKKSRRIVLSQLVGNPIVGEAARGMIRVLERGEIALKADPQRIRVNVERLGGPPRAYENGVANLKESGEFAIPILVEHLRDDTKKALTRPILRALPQIDRPALNPLVIAIQMKDAVTQSALIEAIGQIGYGQAVPYLLKLRESDATSAQVRSAIDGALSRLRSHGVAVDSAGSAAEAFYRLAEKYYANDGSVAADPRLETAQVWYLRDGFLANLEAPTEIFDEIMCMRCCEESLLLNSSFKPAMALWVAANFRREAQLPQNTQDPTRPPNFPTAAFFAQSAGAEVCLLALRQGLASGDASVALGAIEALRKIGGPATLNVDSGGRLPLAEALSFPDRMVRIKAALTLAPTAPQTAFHNHQNLVPVLAETLLLHGGAKNALVIDPQQETANRVAGALREAGYTVIVDGNANTGLSKGRSELPGLDVIVLAPDVQNPDLVTSLKQIRGEFQFASTPILLIAKTGFETIVERLTGGDPRSSTVEPGISVEDVDDWVQGVAKSAGATPVSAELGISIALEAAGVLRTLALTRNSLFDLSRAEPALTTAMGSSSTELRLAAADVLAFIPNTTAQETIAGAALNSEEPEEIRIAMLDALAAAGKRCGNKLGTGSIQALLKIVQGEANMAIREAASRAVGALNLPGDHASELIRSQYQG